MLLRLVVVLVLRLNKLLILVVLLSRVVVVLISNIVQLGRVHYLGCINLRGPIHATSTHPSPLRHSRFSAIFSMRALLVMASC